MPQGFPDDTARLTGSDLYKRISTASTNAVNVKATPGVITGYFLSNQNVTVQYVKLYDKATAPTVGTDTPKWTIALPGLSSAHISFVNPLAFDLGIGLAMTSGYADADTGAVAAGEIIANLAYI